VVYTGAVMMLFLFILMLVGVDTSDSLEENIKGLRVVAILAAIGIGGLLVTLISRATFGRSVVGLSDVNSQGNARGIAEELFIKYVFAFEVVSALLITAAVGAMVLAHSQKSRSKFAQRDLSISRFRKGELKDAAGLPGSGVYALHNAVDVPALLPSGNPAPTSISAVLEARGDMIESSEFRLKDNTEDEK
jgi:NADH-quinone oxidoreductase subunit J